MSPRKTLAVLLLCLLPGLAQAQDDYARPGGYIGLGGTYAFHWFPGNFDNDVTGGTAVKTENSAGLNVRGGYRFNSWAALEGEYEWVSGFENKVGGAKIFDLTYHTFTANGKFLYPGWGRFQPYGLLGVGFAVLQVDSRSGAGATLDGSAVGFAGRVGAGLDVYLSENWLLNAGIDLQLNTAQIDNSSGVGKDVGTLFYVPVQFGVQYRF
jgi:opacity protein-like surface antigen